VDPHTEDGISSIALGVALSAVGKGLKEIIERNIAADPENFLELLDPASSPDPALDAMEAVVDNITNSKDIRDQYSKISQLTRNQDARAEIFNALSITHEYSRYTKFMKARKKIETVLLAVADKGNLTPAESMAFLAYLSAEMKVAEKRIFSNSISGKDIEGLLAKINYAATTEAEAFQEKLRDTSPQNREIVRRLAHKLLAASAGGK
jgi:ribosomal protein L12E/L44/L45/RPP1/RPP2